MVGRALFSVSGFIISFGQRMMMHASKFHQQMYRTLDTFNSYEVRCVKRTHFRPENGPTSVWLATGGVVVVSFFFFPKMSHV